MKQTLQNLKGRFDKVAQDTKKALSKHSNQVRLATAIALAAQATILGSYYLSDDSKQEREAYEYCVKGKANDCTSEQVALVADKEVRMQWIVGGQMLYTLLHFSGLFMGRLERSEAMGAAYLDQIKNKSAEVADLQEERRAMQDEILQLKNDIAPYRRDMEAQKQAAEWAREAQQIARTTELGESIEVSRPVTLRQAKKPTC